MKKYLLSLALIMTSNVFAQSIVDEQITRTKREIDELVKNVSRPTDVKELNTPDFRSWDSSYRAKVVQEIRNYERKVIGLINANLRQPLENYNRVIKSSEFTAAQKEQLLATTEAQLNKAIASANPQYSRFAQELINKVNVTRLVYKAKSFRRIKKDYGYYSCTGYNKMKLTPMMLNENGEVTKTLAKAKKEFVNIGNCKYSKRKDLRASVRNQIDAYNGIIPASLFSSSSHGKSEAFLNGYFPELAKGCERQVCISLKQGTIKETVQKVQAINRSLNFRTLNYKDFNLQAADTVVELETLTSTNYPQAYFDLPFDF